MTRDWIVSVTLGATASFKFSPTNKPGSFTTVPLGNLSVLAMSRFVWHEVGPALQLVVSAGT
jgi:hypothetical protein